jgi:hypothetical protein
MLSVGVVVSTAKKQTRAKNDELSTQALLNILNISMKISTTNIDTFISKIALLSFLFAHHVSI